MDASPRARTRRNETAAQVLDWNSWISFGNMSAQGMKRVTGLADPPSIPTFIVD